MNEVAIGTEGLTKTYANIHAVAGISLTVPRGAICLSLNEPKYDLACTKEFEVSRHLCFGPRSASQRHVKVVCFHALLQVLVLRNLYCIKTGGRGGARRGAYSPRLPERG
jgi:hypothetical protein